MQRHPLIQVAIAAGAVLSATLATIPVQAAALQPAPVARPRFPPAAHPGKGSDPHRPATFGARQAGPAVTTASSASGSAGRARLSLRITRKRANEPAFTLTSNQFLVSRKNFAPDEVLENLIADPQILAKLRETPGSDDITVTLIDAMTGSVRARTKIRLNHPTSSSDKRTPLHGSTCPSPVTCPGPD